jgi:hypothetical protein
MWRPDGPMHETAWWSSWQGAVIIGLLLLIAGLLIWLVLRSRETPGGGAPRHGRGDDEAVALARMRYARGELDRDGYLQVVQDLTGRSPATTPAAAPAVAPEPVASAAEPAAAEPPESPSPPESPTAGPA